MCSSYIDKSWEAGSKCPSRFIHHPFSSLIIFLFNLVGNFIYTIFSHIFDGLFNLKKIIFEVYLNFIFFSIFIFNLILLIKYLVEKYNLRIVNSSLIVLIFFFTSYLGNFLNFETFETILATVIILNYIY